jgi:hypothetical protein
MASRLYPATKKLFCQVVNALCHLGYNAILSPLSLGLLGVYVTGLIVLDKRQTSNRIASWLPARSHDALNRLLRTISISTRVLMSQLICWAKRLNLKGYLVIDDVVVEKPFSKEIPWVGWTYSTTHKGKVLGFHIVVLLWCFGVWRIPVAFRIWRPRKACCNGRYRTKVQLTWEMIVEVVNQGLAIEYIVFDSFYTAGWMTKRINRLSISWVGILDPRTKVCYRNKHLKALKLAEWIDLSWRGKLSLRANSIIAYLPKYGTLRLVVTRNRHGNYEVIATNQLGSDLTTIVNRKRTRWSVETLFRDAKQLAGLGACQCRADQAMVHHVAFCFIAFTLLQLLRLHPEEKLGEVKERLQKEVISGGLIPPQPLKGKVKTDLLLTA